MSTSPNIGLFAWYELLTANPEAAKAFYGAVVGWGTQPFPDPSMNYTMWTNTKGPVGGLMTLDEAQMPGARPHWMGTVSVENTDATVARALELGGKLLHAAHEIPNVGRFAVLQDPTGGTFCVMQSFDPAGPIDMRELGRVGWHELWTSDADAAWAFYAGLFGWVEAGSMEMAPGQVYRMFGRDKDSPHGGIAPTGADGPPTAWLFYATVESADESIGRARELGATIMMGPMDVPGGGRAGGGMDPQGAGFAVFSVK